MSRKSIHHTLVHKTVGDISATGTTSLTNGEALVCKDQNRVQRTLLVDPIYWQSSAEEVKVVFQALRAVENNERAARKEKEYARDKSAANNRRRIVTSTGLY